MQKNWNLSTTTLPPNSASQLVIDEVWGDSQMGMNSIRLSGAWPIANLPFVGRLLSMLSTGSTGVTLTHPTLFNGMVLQTDPLSNPWLRPGDPWASDGNTTDHFNYSVGWNFTQTGTTSRQMFILSVAQSTLYTGSFPIANQALNARVFYRKTATTVPSIRAYPHRNGSRGSFTTITLENTGGIGWFDRSIPASSPASGAEPAGIEIWSDVAYTAGNTLEILGVLIYNVVTGTTVASTGYVHVPIYRSGGSPASLTAQVSDTALDALHTALNGIRGSGTKSVDLVQFEFGHNQNGIYIDTLDALRVKVASSLSGGLFDIPDYLFWAMWAFDGNEVRMGTQAQDLFDYASSNGYGYINLFDTYNGLNPSANGKRFDGTPATYTMDGTNLHPGNTATANLIMQDIEEHWQPANWILSTAPTITALLPADNATGIATSTVPTITISESVAVGSNPAAVIALHDWDTDAILSQTTSDAGLSFTPGSGVISLFGINLSTASPSQHVYITIGVGAIKGTTSDIDLPAVVKGDWDFTMQGSSSGPVSTRSRVRDGMRRRR